jgi:hypothetical protein
MPTAHRRTLAERAPPAQTSAGKGFPVSARIAIVGLVALTFAACSSDPSLMQEAYDACATDGATLPGIEVSEDGASMVIDGEPGEAAPGASIADIACVLVALDTPGSLIAQMDATTALDGLQGAQWQGFTARWTRDANGLDIVIESAD